MIYEVNKAMLYITVENTDGSKLFRYMGFRTKINEFGNIDKIYDIRCKN